jgi:hypothetical protein
MKKDERVKEADMYSSIIQETIQKYFLLKDVILLVLV